MQRCSPNSSASGQDPEAESYEHDNTLSGSRRESRNNYGPLRGQELPYSNVYVTTYSLPVPLY
jgi:hypothetical protein